MELQDIEWVNADREARTDNPVRVIDEDMYLEAATLRLYPDQRQFVLTNGTGMVRFERKTP